MGKPAVFLFDRPLPSESVSLGRLVAFVQYPEQKYFDPAHVLSDKPQVQSSANPISNISKLLDAPNGSAGSLKTLHSFAHHFLGGSSEDNDPRQLAGLRGTHYVLNNADEWFSRICKSELTRGWLEQGTLNGRKAYLVAGIMTVKEGGSGGALDAARKAVAGIRSSIGSSTQTSAVVDSSEKIYGVQYREVVIDKLSSTHPLASTIGKKISWEQISPDASAYDSGMEDEPDGIFTVHLLDGVEDVCGMQIADPEVDEHQYFHMPI